MDATAEPPQMGRPAIAKCWAVIFALVLVVSACGDGVETTNAVPDVPETTPRPPSTTTTATVAATTTVPATVVSTTVTTTTTTTTAADIDEVVADVVDQNLGTTQVSQAGQDCVLAEMMRDDFDGYWTLSDQEQDQYVQALFVDATTTCLSDEDKAAWTANPAIPSDYGDNAVLDGLWQDCDADTYTACDLLFLLAGRPTAYEQHGLTCGGRNSADVDYWCVDQYGNGADLDALADDCLDGDFGACDLLRGYTFSAPDSEAHEIGTTCGHRDPPSEYEACFFRHGFSLHE